MNLKSEYFEAIRAGRKRYELRINDEKRQGIQAGDIVRMICAESPHNYYSVIVQERTVWPTFAEALAHCGIERALPGCTELAAAVALYHEFPGYQAGALAHGVVCFKLGARSRML